MQFIGLKPVRQELPSVEIERDDVVFDLHNDGDLREVAYDFPSCTLRVAFIMKEAAWTVPESVEMAGRATVASATLVFTGVRKLWMSGEFVCASESEGWGFEHYEFRRLGLGLGEFRVVLLNDSEIVVTASRCELLTTTRLPEG